MGHWLAHQDAAKQMGTVKRFDPRYWTIDFPRPMMASVVTTGPHSLRVDAVFYRQNDLAGLIWSAEDSFDHPLLRYETARDFSRCKLSFRWRSSGVKALDEVNGPTLTIEGRDEAGAARSWFVRLWNYAGGSPQDAAVAIDFAALAGGWAGEDTVWPGDIDRMFISLVAPGYSGQDASLGAPAEAWVEVSEIVCNGSGSVLAIGEPTVPEHWLRIATGYDDLYHVTPARMLRNMLQLGYRGAINHYVGMSHYFRLGPELQVAPGLNVACMSWHRDFAAKAQALGYECIWSLSYELLDMHCPEAWKQRAEDGTAGLTGWDPPSALLSPANAQAMAWLQDIACAFAAIAVERGLHVRFQVGEPWWWVTEEGRICLYDTASQAKFAPVPIADVRAALNEAQKATLDAAGNVLAQSTSALTAAVKAQAPDAETLLLVYLPIALAGEVRRANVPVGWAAPAFDVLQLEDYDWVVAGRRGSTAAGIAEATARLGYPIEGQHYLSGFVLRPEDGGQWQKIAAAADSARERGTGEIFVWALPQVLRDGFVHFDGGEEMEAFDDVRFPIALGREASVEPAFSTAVVSTASGAEQRNAEWADARLRFDAGPGIRSDVEVGELIAFFRARRGAAVAFRFEDPFDNSSAGMTGAPDASDQLLGTGDGSRTEFPLVKRYGTQERRITRPLPGSVRVAVGGAERSSGWSLLERGVVSFEAPPAAGQEVRAGFRFDVPVRFAEDRLTLNRATFAAGELPSVPLIEVRE